MKCLDLLFSFVTQIEIILSLLVLLALGILFFLFHLGLRDFQEYEHK